jgi:hypothetical protein
MEYNSQRPPLIISEYGRIVQKMIDHAITIPDRELRNRAARTIVSIMGMLNPQLRDVVDFKHKLWDHLFIMSDFKLDVDSPFPKPSPTIGILKPRPLKYPKQEIKYKFYGKNMERMIEAIASMDEGEERNRLIQTIANFMKLQYLTWNKDSVEDALIFEHLRELSGGKIDVSEQDFKLQQHFVFSTRNAGLTSSQKRKRKKKKRFNSGS